MKRLFPLFMLLALWGFLAFRKSKKAAKANAK